MAVPAHQGEWTFAEIQAEYRRTLPNLPLAEHQLGAVIRLPGRSGWFDDAPLLDDAWLDGRMTSGEYVALVQSVNDAVNRLYVGEAKHVFFSNTLWGVRRSYDAIRAHLARPDVAAWWRANRGVSIAFQAPAGAMESQVFFVILSKPAVMAGRGTHELGTPPVYASPAIAPFVEVAVEKDAGTIAR